MRSRATSLLIVALIEAERPRWNHEEHEDIEDHEEDCCTRAIPYSVCFVFFVFFVPSWFRSRSRHAARAPRQVEHRAGSDVERRLHGDPADLRGLRVLVATDARRGDLGARRLPR
jgi:hypothetical protein